MSLSAYQSIRTFVVLFVSLAVGVVARSSEGRKIVVVAVKWYELCAAL